MECRSSILYGSDSLALAISDCSEVAGYLWEKGWAERNGGNIVVNITEYAGREWADKLALSSVIDIGGCFPDLKGCYFYCKGTEKRMRDLARFPMKNGSVIRICDNCSSYEIIADYPVLPTSELSSHLSVHDYLIHTKSEFKATLHTHPTELVAMSHNNDFLQKDVLTNLLWGMIPEAKIYCPNGLGIVDYKQPGSDELAKATLEKLKRYDIVLWQNHGVFSVGNDIIDAFDKVDVLNKSAQIYIAAKSMGFEPQTVSYK